MSYSWFSYRCPVCHAALVAEGRSYQCVNGHNFDRAQKGYVNLLLAQQKSSSQPGDGKEMIRARREFLSAGFYTPVAEAIANLCRQQGIRSILDAGCGEGYYAEQLHQAGFQVAGVDISKEAILAACQRDKQLPWSVASVANLPYLDNSFDAVLSVFCRIELQEFKRVARDGGLVIYVGPGTDHLASLRARLYDRVRDYAADKPQGYFDGAEAVFEQQLRFPLLIENPRQISNLLAMTPHYWSTNQTQHQRLLDGGALHDNADIQIKAYRLEPF